MKENIGANSFFWIATELFSSNFDSILQCSVSNFILILTFYNIADFSLWPIAVIMTKPKHKNVTKKESAPVVLWRQIAMPIFQLDLSNP